MIISVSSGYSDNLRKLIKKQGDPRFTNIQTDPRFRLPSRKSTHVEIDKRFARMLHDEEFSSRAKVDRYGRRLPKDAGRKELERYYRIEDEEDVNEDEGIGLESEHVGVNSEMISVSSSSSDESSSDEESDEVEEEGNFGFPDEKGADGEGIPIGEPSSRLAVVNLDWDNIRAADLLAVFSSFTPSNGLILKVSVYPSEFGRERMEREEMEGPPKEIFGQTKPEIQNDYIASESDSDEEDADGADEDERIKNSILKEDKGQEFNSAKLRRYQLERLRYYYAVLNCSSTAVAQAIYNAVDGTEYLTTANFFDLRFIPDEMEFSHDKVRDECETVPDSYRPNEFVTDALQHSKVRLTWDADDGTRKEVQKRAFTGSRADMDENDLKAYLGSDSSDNEVLAPTVLAATSKLLVDGNAGGDVKEPDSKLSKKEVERQKMRELLGLENEPAVSKGPKAEIAPVGDMQITFSSGLSSEPKKGSVFENEPERDETTVEKYVRKERERKSRRKEKTRNNRIATSEIVEHVNTKTQQSTKTRATSASPSSDLGFSDPFFTTAPSQKPSNPKPKPPPSTAHPPPPLPSPPPPRSSPPPPTTTSHFSMPEIELAEKLRRNPKKKRKLSQRQKAALDAMQQQHQTGGGGAFQLDVDDPRFGAVFERTEFAIDPLHKGFKDTQGMRLLLEEGRRRRREERDDERDGDGDGGGREKRRRKDKREEVGGEGEVQRLVKSVKGKLGMKAQ